MEWEHLNSNHPAFDIEGIGFENPDPYDFFTIISNNYTSNEKLKLIINQATSLVEKPEDRLRLYIEAERIASQEEVPFIPLFFQKLPL